MTFTDRNDRDPTVLFALIKKINDFKALLSDMRVELHQNISRDLCDLGTRFIKINFTGAELRSQRQLENLITFRMLCLETQTLFKALNDDPDAEEMAHQLFSSLKKLGFDYYAFKKFLKKADAVLGQLEMSTNNLHLNDLCQEYKKIRRQAKNKLDVIGSFERRTGATKNFRAFSELVAITCSIILFTLATLNYRYFINY